MKNLLLFSTLFYAVACGYSSHPDMMMEELAMDVAFEDIMEEVPATRQSAPQEAGESVKITKKVIKTGGIDFESEDVEGDYKKIRELLPKFGAYIENENQSKSTSRINYYITVRVPSTIYDSLYATFSSIAIRLDNKYSNVQDVTERYYDLKSRIKNKKALEQRYLELLEKASAIKDILEIERNLNEVRSEIERLQGQFNYLSKQVNYSTITLSFYEELPYVYDSSQREGFGARILSSLDSGWQGFLSFIVGFTTLWPFVILITGLVYLIRKLRKKWKSKKG